LLHWRKGDLGGECAKLWILMKRQEGFFGNQTGEQLGDFFSASEFCSGLLW
jgi:hypothetical protein